MVNFRIFSLHFIFICIVSFNSPIEAAQMSSVLHYLFSFQRNTLSEQMQGAPLFHTSTNRFDFGLFTARIMHEVTHLKADKRCRFNAVNRVNGMHCNYRLNNVHRFQSTVIAGSMVFPAIETIPDTQIYPGLQLKSVKQSLCWNISPKSSPFSGSVSTSHIKIISDENGIVRGNSFRISLAAKSSASHIECTAELSQGMEGERNGLSQMFGIRTSFSAGALSVIFGIQLSDPGKALQNAGFSCAAVYNHTEWFFQTETTIIGGNRVYGRNPVEFDASIGLKKNRWDFIIRYRIRNQNAFIPDWNGGVCSTFWEGGIRYHL